MTVQKGNYGSQVFSKVKMFLFTTLAAVVIAAVLLLITAVLLDKMGLGEKQVRLLIYGVYIISGLTAGIVAGKWQRTRKFVWGALAGVVWLAVVLLVSICVNGTVKEAGELFPAAVCMIGGGMLGGMLA